MCSRGVRSTLGTLWLHPHPHLFPFRRVAAYLPYRRHGMASGIPNYTTLGVVVFAGVVKGRAEIGGRKWDDVGYALVVSFVTATPVFLFVSVCMCVWYVLFILFWVPPFLSLCRPLIRSPLVKHCGLSSNCLYQLNNYLTYIYHHLLYLHWVILVNETTKTSQYSTVSNPRKEARRQKSKTD